MSPPSADPARSGGGCCRLRVGGEFPSARASPSGLRGEGIWGPLPGAALPGRGANQWTASGSVAWCRSGRREGLRVGESRERVPLSWPRGPKGGRVGAFSGAPANLRGGHVVWRSWRQTYEPQASGGLNFLARVSGRREASPWGPGRPRDWLPGLVTPSRFCSGFGAAGCRLQLVCGDLPIGLTSARGRGDQVRWTRDKKGGGPAPLNRVAGGSCWRRTVVAPSYRRRRSGGKCRDFPRL